jgi:hypothetical protein
VVQPVAKVIQKIKQETITHGDPILIVARNIATTKQATISGEVNQIQQKDIQTAKPVPVHGAIPTREAVTQNQNMEVQERDRATLVADLAAITIETDMVAVRK